MANTIRLKRGTTTPAAGSLVTGELAINTTTGAVFTKTDGGSVVNVAGSATASWGGISGTLSSQSDLNTALSGKAASVHTHAISDVTNLQTSLDAKASLDGATFTGKVNTAASTATNAGLNIGQGLSPSAPVNGDLWVTTAGLCVRTNGATHILPGVGVNNTFSNANSTYGSATTTGSIGLASGATTSGQTKTVNVGTGGLAGSTTNITIGSTTGTSTTTLQGNTNGVTQTAGNSTTLLATTDFVTTADNLKANLASPTFTGTVTIPAGASISGYLTSDTAASTYQTLAGMSSYLTTATAATTYAPIASPALTGNVTITSNSANAALFIEQAGTGNILTLHDQASDTTFVAIDANGKVSTIPSTTAGAGFNIAHGVAPTTFVDGDVWTTTGGLFWRQNGATKQAMNLGDTQTVSGNITFSNTNLTFGNANGGSTTNLATGPTNSGTSKTVNIGTNGVSGSTTNITVGPVAAASTTSIGNTTAASTLNLATGATLTATTKAVNIGTNGVAGSTTNITIGSTTGTSTTTLQGITNGVTAAADTNSTQIATTAFVVGQAGSATPLVNGTAAVGTSLRYARQDHVHPSDNSVKAWVNFDGSGTVSVRASYNVSSITDNATGSWTINFTTAMADANYATVTGLAHRAGVTRSVSVSTDTQTINNVSVTTGYSTTMYDATTVSVAILR